MLLGLVTHLALIGGARAQDSTAGFDAHGFTLAAMDGDPRDPLYLSRPGRFEGGQFFVGGLFEYAKSPLALVYVDENGNVTGTEDVLDNVFALNVSAGAAVFDRLRLDVAAPLFFASSGQGGDPQGFALGDLRASAMVAIVRPTDSPDGGGLGLGVVPYLDIPTGADGKFLGQGGVAGGGKVTASYELGGLTLGGEVGAQFNPSITLENLSNSDSLTTGVSIGYLVTDTLGLTAEAHLASPFQASVQRGTASPAELLLSARKRTHSGGFLVLGGAAGLSEGAGAAVYRVFLGGGFGKVSEPAAPVVDTDGDGLLDNVDACPNEPETKNGYKDDDGCPDALAGVRVVVTKDGKPYDGATVKLIGGDTTQEHTSSASQPWVVEALPGTEWSARASGGSCLAGEGKATAGEGTVDLTVPLEAKRTAIVKVEVVDTDGKPIPNAEVKWEKDPDGCVGGDAFALTDGAGTQRAGAGKHRLFASAPDFATKDVLVDVPTAGEVPVRVVLPTTKVKLEIKQISILDKVYFETDSDVIKGESFDLLNEVASVIMSHPEIGRVEVQGHTDSDGRDDYNLQLSDRRAQSVRRYLEGRGVDPARLLAKGYGETLPLMPNTTESGKAKNRRVEFKLIDAPAGGAVKEAPK